MVVQDQTEMFLNLNHHPVCAASDASALSSYWRSHLLARRAMAGPSNRIADAARVVEGMFQGLYIDRLGIT